MTLIRHYKILFGALAALAFAGGRLHATPIILDNFTALQTLSTGDLSLHTNTLNTATVVGDYRTIQAKKTEPGSSLRRVDVGVDPNLRVMTFEQGVGVKGQAQVTYNGAATGFPAAIPGQPATKNITPFDAWETGYGLNVFGQADNTGLPVTFTFYGAGANATATLQLRANNQNGAYVNPYYINTLPGGMSHFFIPLTDFSPSSGQLSDIFSAVNAFQIYFDGTASTAGTDAQLSYYGIGPVPEPGTYALIGIGLVGLVVLRKRYAETE